MVILAKKPRSARAMFQLKITLHGTHPPIWRRLAVPGDIKLATLHDVFQFVMGWHDCHLHSFRIGGDTYEPPAEDDCSDSMFRADFHHDERPFRLNDLLKAKGDHMVYEYDFGDGWQHEIRLENILPPSQGPRFAICLAGARACPPEDCGGVHGYTELLAIITDPKHPENARMMKWLGDGFDPEAFDAVAIDAQLRRLEI
jgi:hypothetical protein